MQEQALAVGEELVIEGGIRLTVLAVEAGEVLLSLTAPDPQTWETRRPGIAARLAPRSRTSPPTSSL
jgi:hypothetical protein